MYLFGFSPLKKNINQFQLECFSFIIKLNFHRKGSFKIEKRRRKVYLSSITLQKEKELKLVNGT